MKNLINEFVSIQALSNQAIRKKDFMLGLLIEENKIPYKYNIKYICLHQAIKYLTI